jgi:TPR repeat protein
LLDFLAARIDWNLVNVQLDDFLPKRSAAVCVCLINLPVNGLFVAMKTFRIHLLMLPLPLVGFCICAFGQATEASKYQDSLDAIKIRASAGDSYYMAAYAEVLRRGEFGVSTDQDAALKWARKSAADGHALGKYNVWAIKKADALIPQFLDGLKQLAADGSSRAQSCLGVIHHFGNGVPKDDKAAVKWFTTASDQGFAPAQSNLGGLYATGEGVPKDPKVAVRWYGKAADQGYAFAHYHLGFMHYFGRGVPKDAPEVLKSYRKAADQGVSFAQFNLGVAYHNGEGVPKDDIRAYAWCSLAASSDLDDAREKQDQLKKMLTPEQITAALKLAHSLVAVPGKN